jgi:hypothetical protein
LNPRASFPQNEVYINLCYTNISYSDNVNYPHPHSLIQDIREGKSQTNMKRFLVSLTFTLAVLTTSIAFAQGGFVGGGLAAADIPAFVVLGYNATLFGVRLSSDTTFAGLEGYLRVQFFEAGSSFYLGAGLGLRPYALWVYQDRPALAESSEVPLSLTWPVGFELRSEDIGFFLEYAPTLPISGTVDFYNLIGFLRFRLGVSYYF